MCLICIFTLRTQVFIHLGIEKEKVNEVKKYRKAYKIVERKRERGKDRIDIRIIISHLHLFVLFFYF